MVFASYGFVFMFLPATLILFYALRSVKAAPDAQKLALIAASLVFYGFNNPAYLLIITSSIAVGYICGSVIIAAKDNSTLRRGAFFAGIAFNTALLGYFKYRDFFAYNINTLFNTSIPLAHIALPLGISFFTFQQISFLKAAYDCRDGSINPRFADYSLFVLFFPQLVAGPIVSYKEMAPQLTSCGRRRHDEGDMAAHGVYIFAFGLFKKIVVADTLAIIADNGFAIADPTCAQAWGASLAYTFQIYFDFCGYSDMAVGLGKMFGFELPINFNSPYKSKSITEFWRRWHITLGRTLSELIYFPLGGSRNGLMRTCASIFAVFAVSGLWHGASWKFVLWGLLHGTLAVIERIAGHYYERIPALVRRIYTFLAINALWVFFRADDTITAVRILRSMIDLRSFSLTSLAPLTLDGVVDFPARAGAAYVILLLSVCLITTAFPQNAIERSAKMKMTYRSAAFVTVMLVLSIVHMSRLSVFIYFNF